MKSEIFSVTLSDGSVFTMPDPRWQRALELKNPKGWNTPSFEEEFRQAVAKYWEERKEPTKFEFDEPWQEEYETQAALAEKVMYQYIRAALFAVAFKEMGVETQVIALSDGSARNLSQELEEEALE